MVNSPAAEKAVLTSVWKQVDVEGDGQETLVRLRNVFPRTKILFILFMSFGDLSTPAAIGSNTKVKAHDKKVLSALGAAVNNPDRIKRTLAHLSKVDADKLQVDPSNFWEGCWVIELIPKRKAAFTPQLYPNRKMFLAEICLTAAIP